MFKKNYLPLVAALLLVQPQPLRAQTDADAIMMSKKNLCMGPSYGYSSWNHYWEGTFYRNNQNIGIVTTQMISVMGIYGITRNLNVVAMAPYIWTRASAGTLTGQHGVQDLSAWLKWRAIDQQLGNGTLSVFVLGGASVPLTNYIAAYLPLSIGLQSKTLSGRLIADYQLGHFFVTASGTYTFRSDITIDQNSYYTTSLHLTNRVDMPNVAAGMLRAGYRKGDDWTIEALLSNMNTLGGFDIRKNDMPFPSNTMNSTMVGAHVKYGIRAVSGLSVDLEGDNTVAGRNVGRSTSFDFGVLYVLHLSKNASRKPITSSSTH